MKTPGFRPSLVCVIIASRVCVPTFYFVRWHIFIKKVLFLGQKNSSAFPHTLSMWQRMWKCQQFFLTQEQNFFNKDVPAHKIKCWDTHTFITHTILLESPQNHNSHTSKHHKIKRQTPPRPAGSDPPPSPSGPSFCPD
jgi:hypothetical protein